MVRTTLSAYNAYVLFHSLKNHFKSGSTYNFHRYQGRLKTISLDDFQRKPDRIYYERLAKRPDPLAWCVASLSHNPSLWINEMATPEAEAAYNAYQARRQSLTYTFERELPYVESIDDLFKTDGTHPKIVKEWLGGRTSLVTLCVLDQVTGFTSKFKTSRDPILKECRERILKLAPFITFDLEKIENVLTRKYSWEASLSKTA